ncbi:allophanate hydrolase [Bordetella genomosp. 10]|uniref:Allophanate hydrolase n=1 Tax=Bordetella genomosp. 10 TaxID=1416804 RepID=A0A261S198_9BORD|nr:biotin-dependent carboxyltransferase family protein [Bordetella genomosp. 10]OZI31106.1 allophanate hydrolase [Bordetella genomosp. 10]
MAKATIEVLSSGALNLVQDRGRIGFLGAGVSRGGAMDEPALVMANELVGNEANAAALEINVFPQRLRVQDDIWFACTGAQSRVTLDGAAVPTWTRVRAAPGQVLVIEAPRLGCRAYIAFSGGIDVQEILGSRSTDLKAGFGGYEGRGLRRGDVLTLGVSAGLALSEHPGIAPAERVSFLDDLKQGVVRVRIIPATEYDCFTGESLAHFREGSYRISSEANRVGYRLMGEPLKLAHPLELFSHGIIPGTVQVPPNGQPIVQMAEANTCGGYPKIAAVIQADLWRLAQAPVGCAVRFTLTTIDAALEALRR